MRNTSLYRSNLSDENVAFLSELKDKNELNVDDNTPKAYKRQEIKKDNELDVLWPDLSQSFKEEKSPAVYVVSGFVFGAVCMFALYYFFNASFSLIPKNSDVVIVNQHKTDRHNNVVPADSEQSPSSITVVPAATQQDAASIPSNQTYTVKQGDSMSSIVYRFYGKYDVDKLEKIKQVNNLSSEHKLSIGQQLIIPMD